MIQNLNPISFQQYGFILPDRQKDAGIEQNSVILHLKPDNSRTPVFQTNSDTTLCVTAGKSILSVSPDGESFLHYYLDKPVCIKNDVFFSISPFKGAVDVVRTCKKTPTQIGSRPRDTFRVDRSLRIDGIYTFFYQEREQGFIFPGEEHPMPELTYVDQGELHSVADGHDILLKQGEIAFFGPNQWHMHYADMGVAPRYVTISFDLDGVDITPLLNRKFSIPQQAVALIQQMLREQERMDSYSTDMMIAQLSELILTILRYADSPSSNLQASNSLHSENEIIRQAQQYISTHVREKLSVPLVARMADVSPSYLTSLFHKNLQISPGEYIRRIKLQESKQMIREGNMNFTEIAATLQYSTVHHFSRQFKDKFGITPSEYAKSVR